MEKLTDLLKIRYLILIFLISCLTVFLAITVADIVTPPDRTEALDSELPVTTDLSLREANKYDFLTEKMADFELNYERPALGVTDSDLAYKTAFLELPLIGRDYYLGKYENAVAGTVGINKIPPVKPGEKVGIVRQKFINIKAWNGYIQAPARYFGSGVCWSTSALGLMMDKSNAQFKNKYGLDLFVYKAWDRAPHPDYYETYKGNGYTILQLSEGNPLQDYTFTVNPAIKEIPDLAGLKIKLVMLHRSDHKTASHGQSIAGYLLPNKEF